MKIEANSPEEYIASIPEDRKKPVSELRQVINENLPEGFEETISYGMIGFVISTHGLSRRISLRP